MVFVLVWQVRCTAPLIFLAKRWEISQRMRWENPAAPNHVSFLRGHCKPIDPVKKYLYCTALHCTCTELMCISHKRDSSILLYIAKYSSTVHAYSLVCSVPGEKNVTRSWKRDAWIYCQNIISYMHQTYLMISWLFVSRWFYFGADLYRFIEVPGF
jgi:hypothetical protein